MNLNERVEIAVNEALRKLVSEAPERVVTNDPFVDFTKSMKDGQIAMFGYLNYAYMSREEMKKLFPMLDDETIGKRYDQLSLKPTRKRMDPELAAKFRGYRDEHLAGKPDSEIDKFLSTTLDDIDAYNADTRKTKRKTIDLPFSDRYAIVEFMALSVTWRSAKGLANFYKNTHDDYLRLRKDYGFGEEGAENTWRGKSTVIKTGKNAGKTKYTYGGAGLLPIVNPDAPDNAYKKVSYGEDFADTYEDETTGMKAYRQQATVYGTPRYFLVNMDNGKTEELSKSFVDFLKKGMSSRTTSAVEELEEDERAYKDALKLIRDKESSVWNLLKDKTLYIHATKHAQNGDKTPIDYTNQELEAKFPEIVRIIKSSGNRTGTMESMIRNAVRETISEMKIKRK